MVEIVFRDNYCGIKEKMGTVQKAISLKCWKEV